jgi:hypothetical protein
MLQFQYQTNIALILVIVYKLKEQLYIESFNELEGCL